MHSNVLNVFKCVDLLLNAHRIINADQVILVDVYFLFKSIQQTTMCISVSLFFSVLRLKIVSMTIKLIKPWSSNDSVY